MKLTAERAREVLDYDPETGVFRWRVTRKGVTQGALAGGIDFNGYLVIRVDYKLYLGHRLAWLMMTGEWPPCQIDHKDLDRANNAFDNLRAATPSQNQENRPAPRSNTSGAKGVHYRADRNKWQARIQHKGTVTMLGTHSSLEAAAEAYCRAAARIHKEFART